MYMLAKLFEVKNTGNKGKGLFAKVPIPKGTIVSFECPICIRISKDDFKSLLTNNEKSLILRYAYRKADGSYLLPCDEIIYLNHSCNAKILDSEKGFDIVVKDIAKGEEATYDYRSFFFHDPEEFECICGEDNCCKIVRSVHDQHNPRRFEVMKIWKKSVHDALIYSDKIAQPLNEKLTYIEFFKMNSTVE
jgi:SET domain-containing protein